MERLSGCCFIRIVVRSSRPRASRVAPVVVQRLVHQLGETREQDRPGGVDADAARLRVKICLIDVETEIVHRRPRAIRRSLKSDPSSRGVSTRTHRRAASQRALVFAAAFWPTLLASLSARMVSRSTVARLGSTGNWLNPPASHSDHAGMSMPSGRADSVVSMPSPIASSLPMLDIGDSLIAPPLLRAEHPGRVRACGRQAVSGVRWIAIGSSVTISRTSATSAGTVRPSNGHSA